MNLYSKNITDQQAEYVQKVQDLSSLSVFVEPTCPAVIWTRQVPPETQSWINQLNPKLLPNCRKLLRTSDARKTIKEIFSISKTPYSTGLEWLTQDITLLTEFFSSLMKVKFVRLRLNVVSTDSCRKPHVDAISGRLICTYRGTGTQYGFSTDGGDPKSFLTTPTGSPILFRGTLWPENPFLGLLHRSPPIEGSGETRFVLVIDPIIDPENEE